MYLHFSNLFVVDSFLDDKEEALLCSNLESLDHQFHRVSGRDVSMLGGVPFERGMLAKPLPPFLAPLLTRLAPIFGGSTPNHVLVNRYDVCGGIMPHTDGPLYLARVAIVSLRAPTQMDFGEFVETDVDRFVRREWRIVDSVVLRPKSLLVFEADAYEKYLHTIESTSDARAQERRISLTIRIVNKVVQE
jgi:hypothetical protein